MNCRITGWNDLDKCSLKSMMWAGRSIGWQCEWDLIQEKSLEVFFLSALGESPLTLTSAVWNRATQLPCSFGGVWLSVHQMQLHTPPKHSSLQNCLGLAEQDVVFHGIIVWTRKTYERAPVSPACWFRGTSVRFVFWLLRSEFSLALANHEIWTTACCRNVLPLVV